MPSLVHSDATRAVHDIFTHLHVMLDTSNEQPDNLLLGQSLSVYSRNLEKSVNSLSRVRSYALYSVFGRTPKREAIMLLTRVFPIKTVFDYKTLAACHGPVADLREGSMGYPWSPQMDGWSTLLPPHFVS